MTNSLLIAIQKEKETWRSLGFQDARAGKPQRPLAAINPYWVEIYEKGFQEGLLPEVADEADSPF